MLVSLCLFVCRLSLARVTLARSRRAFVRSLCLPPRFFCNVDTRLQFSLAFVACLSQALAAFKTVKDLNITWTLATSNAKRIDFTVSGKFESAVLGFAKKGDFPVDYVVLFMDKNKARCGDLYQKSRTETATDKSQVGARACRCFFHLVGSCMRAHTAPLTHTGPRRLHWLANGQSDDGLVLAQV